MRRLRLDQGVLLKDMADVLNVTPSYLSAVEHGTRRIPTGWVAKIADAYVLSDVALAELTDAVVELAESVVIPFNESISPEKRAALVQFARSYAQLDTEDIRQLASPKRDADRDT
jgi:transcriptional regulator with XRE-family HTH domain